MKDNLFTKLLLTVILLVSFKVFGATIEVAVTVDDLPVHDTGLPALETAKGVISALKSYQVPHPYGFTNAMRMDWDPKADEVMRLWVASGFPLGNHEYFHKNLNETSAEEFTAGIESNDRFIRQYLPPLPPISPLVFRYPFLAEGDTLAKRAAVRRYLFVHGYKIAPVTIDFADWIWNESSGSCYTKGDFAAIEWLKSAFVFNAVEALRHSERMAQLAFGRSIKHILLLHIGSFDSRELKDVLAAYVRMGVRFIELEEALQDPIYAFDPNLPGGGNFLNQVLAAKGIETPPAYGVLEESVKAACR